MKIIASTGQHYSPEEFVCTVSRAELEKLAGHYFGPGTPRPEFTPGVTINIDAMARAASQMADVRASLQHSVATLRACADLVSGQVEVIATPVVEGGNK